MRASWCVSIAAAVAGPLRAQAQAPLATEPYIVHRYDGPAESIAVARLAVPESPGSADGKHISLGFLLLRSTAASPGTPIVFLMGGPGIPWSAMAPIPPYWQLFQRLRGLGDVILLDQRGVGFSTPGLDCPPPAAPPDTLLLESRAALVAAFRRDYAACDSLWRQRGADPSANSIAASADDIDAVRRALGAERVRLLGFSYGTRLALEYLRRHPDQVDRVVLQGPEDRDLRYRSPAALDSLLSRHARLAAADSTAAPFAANLLTRIAAALDALGRAPVAVRVAGPRGDSVTLRIGREGLQSLIAQRPGDARLPALIATLERGDTRLLARSAQALYDGVASGGGSLMGRAAECSEPPSPARVREVDRAGRSSLLGPLFENDVVRPAFCDAIGLRAAAQGASSARPPRAGRPTLIIVGDLDTQTPVANAAAIARTLPGSTRLVVENGQHELLTEDVVQDAVVDFFQGRDVGGRQLRVAPPRFLSIDEAVRPPRGGRR